jgi:hypothetical protein
MSSRSRPLLSDQVFSSLDPNAKEVGAEPSGRLWIMLPFAPLSAMTVLVAAILWARWLRPCHADVRGALLVVEVLALGLAARVAEAPFLDTTAFFFWAAVSMLFDPRHTATPWRSAGCAQ